MKYNNVVITEWDFKRERTKRDNELLTRIAKSKSMNKLWLAHKQGFDVDYDPVPAKGQDE